jgi:dihydrofolate reductase
MGGSQIYELALSCAEELYITRVHAEVDGDIFFPKWNPSEWELISSEDHDADNENDFPFTWEVYKRR